MNRQQDWTTLFQESTLLTGRRYAQDNAVVGVDASALETTATVTGLKEHFVRIRHSYEGGILSMSCSCAQSARTLLCPHMAALLTFLDSTGRPLSVLSTSPHELPDSAAVTETPADSHAEGTDLLSQMQILQQEERKKKYQPKKSDQLLETLRSFRPDEYISEGSVSEELLQEARDLLAQNNHEPLRVSMEQMPRYPRERFVCAASFDSIVSIEKGGWSAYVETGASSVLHAQCRCKSHEEFSGKHIRCCHEAAAVLLVQDYLKAYTRGDFTDETGEKLLALRGQYAMEEEVLAETHPKKEPLSLKWASGAGEAPMKRNLPYGMRKVAAEEKTFRPLLEVSPEGSLYAGAVFDGLPVKKVSAFLTGLQKGTSVRSGSAELKVTRNQIEKASLPYLDFLTGLLHSRGDLLLEGESLDTFFTFCAARQIQVCFHGKEEEESGKYTFWDGKLDVELLLTPEWVREVGAFEGITLSGSVPRVFAGASYGYFFQGQNFIRTTQVMGASKAILDLAKDGELTARIGQNHMPEFMHQTLPWIENYIPVSLSEEDRATIESYLPQKADIIIYLDYLDKMVVCRAEACYGARIYSLAEHLEGQPKSKDRYRYRNKELEKKALEILTRYLPEYNPKQRVFFEDGKSPLVDELLQKGLKELFSFCDVRATNRFRRMRKKDSHRMKLSVSVGSGMLDLGLSSDVLTEDEVRAILDGARRKAKYVKLKSGELIDVAEDESVMELIQLMQELHVSLDDFVEGKMSIPSYRALYVSQMLQQHASLYEDRDVIFGKLVADIGEIGEKDLVLPSHFQGELRPYQMTGFRWMRTLDLYGFGGILADEMGLGKTPQTISALLSSYEEEWARGDEGREEHHASLIVCPSSLVYNWASEIARFAPSLQVGLISGKPWLRMRILRSSDQYDVVVTSYDLVRRDISDFTKATFRYIILDEAQYIKNKDSAVSQCCKLLKGKTRIALTGTPIENRLHDLWSIFDFCMPGFLYSYHTFASEFVGGGSSSHERLIRMITPFVLRRLKMDVLKDLPDKLEEVRFAKMDEKQAQLYKALHHAAKTKVSMESESTRGSSMRLLAELTKLRQVCCDPSLLYEDYEGHSCKRQLCMDLIRSLIEGGHKTIIFSQFVTMMELLEEDLENEGITYYKITGNTPSRQRVEIVEEFNHNDVPVIMVSLKAGGTGLNITGADVVIHYDPWWNYSVESQATDRAHRIGQKKIVTVYKLIVKGSIEEKILEMQQTKRQLAETILNGEGMASGSFSKEELMALFEEEDA